MKCMTFNVKTVNMLTFTIRQRKVVLDLHLTNKRNPIIHQNRNNRRAWNVCAEHETERQKMLPQDPCDDYVIKSCVWEYTGVAAFGA